MSKAKKNQCDCRQYRNTGRCDHLQFMDEEDQEDVRLGPELGNWTLRAVAAVAYLQMEELPIPKLSLTKIVYGSMGGRNREMIDYLEKWVKDAQKQIEEAQARRKK